VYQAGRAAPRHLNVRVGRWAIDWTTDAATDAATDSDQGRPATTIARSSPGPIGRRS
jgi:hypothetical protein